MLHNAATWITSENTDITYFNPQIWNYSSI